MHKWYRLDNAASLFPSVTNKKNTAIFRISAVLKKEVDKDVLEKVINEVIERYPMFKVKLRKGLFWNYLDTNTQKVVVHYEKETPCKKLPLKDNNGYLFQVIYYHHRLSLEMFHALTDGSGAIELFKSILYYYLKETGVEIVDSQDINLIGEPATFDEVEDSFTKYYDKNTPTFAPDSSSYKIKGHMYVEEEHHVIQGIVNGQQLNKIAKSYGGSITAYLTALMIYSIYHGNSSSYKVTDPIFIAVPVNLRKLFPSTTLRNFFGVVNLGSVVTDDTKLEDLVPIIQAQLIEKTQKNYLQHLINKNVTFQNNLFVKIVPLIIKNIFVKIGFNLFSEDKKAITLTNLGRIDLPKEMTDSISHWEIFAYPTAKSPMGIGVISAGEMLTISFIKHIEENQIIQTFFSTLAKEKDLEVIVYGNMIPQ